MDEFATRRRVLGTLAAVGLSGCLRNTSQTQSIKTQTQSHHTRTDTDSQTTVPEWSLSFSAPPTTQPVIRDGTAFVGSTNHRLYAIDTATGTEQFATDVGDQVGYGLAYRQGTIYGSSRAGIFGVDATGGDVVLSTSNRFTGFGTETPLVGDGRLYYPGGSLLSAIDTDTGGSLWESRSAAWGGSPALADGTLVVSDAGNVDTTPSDRSRVFGLDPEKGTVQWETRIESDSLVSAVALSADGQTAVLSGRYGMTAAFDTNTGDELWRATIDRGGNVHSNPIIIGKTVIVPQGNSGLYGYSLSDGDLRWTELADRDVGYRVGSSGGRAIIAADSVYEIQPSNGSIVTRYDLSPPIAEGLLPALTENGLIYPSNDSSVRRVPR